MFYIELVWNREFDWVSYGSGWHTVSETIGIAKSLYDSGDGARVKKVKVVDSEGNVCWSTHLKSTNNPVGRP